MDVLCRSKWGEGGICTCQHHVGSEMPPLITSRGPTAYAKIGSTERNRVQALYPNQSILSQYNWCKISHPAPQCFLGGAEGDVLTSYPTQGRHPIRASAKSNSAVQKYFLHSVSAKAKHIGVATATSPGEVLFKALDPREDRELDHLLLCFLFWDIPWKMKSTGWLCKVEPPTMQVGSRSSHLGSRKPELNSI